MGIIKKAKAAIKEALHQQGSIRSCPECGGHVTTTTHSSTEAGKTVVHSIIQRCQECAWVERVR